MSSTLVELTNNNNEQPDVESGAAILSHCAELASAGHFAEALTDLSQVLRKATATGDLALSAGTLYQTAWCCLRIGKNDAGLDCVLEARRQWVRFGNVAETARAMALESMLLLDVGMADEGYEEAEQAISAAEMAGDPDILAFARNVKACILAVCGQPELARPMLEASIEVVAETGDDRAHAYYHLNLGYVHFKLFEMAEHAREIDQAIDHLDKAVAVSEQAVQLAFEAADMWVLRTAIANAAELNARAGHLARARDLMVEWDEVTGDPGVSSQIHYLYTLGDIMLRQGEMAEALRVCQQALALADTNRQVDHMLNTTRKLADIHAALGDHELAFELHKKFHALHVKQTGETARRRANTNAVRLQTAQWRQKASQFEDQALRDPLTQIANRRSFDQKLASLAGKPLALGIVDLDHFKAVNDAHSHIIGDEVLKRVSKLLGVHVGENGLAARLGGEEFGLIFAGSSLTEATERSSRLRAALAEQDWSDLASPLTITVSIGLAAGDGAADTGVLMATADNRLYAAKRQGRDQVVSDDESESPQAATG